MQKKNFIWKSCSALLMMAMIGLGTVSCGSDDDDNPAPTPTPVVPGDTATTAVVPTKGTHRYVMKFTNFGDQVVYYKDADITFRGSAVSVAGLSDYLPDSLVYGTIEGNVLTLPEAYLGSYKPSEMMETGMPITFMGATFQIDTTTGVFTSKDGFYTLSGQTPMDRFINITMNPVVERAATPATPQCNFAKFNTGTMYVVNMNIPLFDTEDRALLSDKLSYVVYYEKNGQVQPITFTPDLYTKLTEPMTEIPYRFTDKWDIDNYMVFMNQGKDELKSWSRVGVQTIYRGGGAENRSEVAWFDMSTFKW